MLLKLVWRNIWARKLRTVLTVGSVGLAVFLLCFLQAGVTALTSTVDSASQKRLMVQSAVSLFVELPLAYEQRLEQIEGVDWVCKWQWFGGSYRDDNSFAQFGIDPDTLKKSYPEIDVVDGDYESFKANRTGCMVGMALVEKYGWKVGDQIPIEGTIFRQADGSAWEFTVEAIYDSKFRTFDRQTIYFHFKALEEAIDSGAAEGPEGVGVYMLQLADGANATSVMQEVDALYERGPQRVQTTTEAEFNRQFVSMLGNVPLLLRIVGVAVLFAIFFAVLNTMLMAGRERTKDVGIMKALGFSDGVVARLLLTESVLLCAVGGLGGAAIAYAIEASIAQFLASTVAGFRIDIAIAGIGVAVALVVGVACGLSPARRALNLRPVEALRSDA